MANHPTHMVCERQLGDGRCVTIRPIRHADENAEMAFLRELSEDSLRNRFMKWVQSPSEKPAHYFSDIDYGRHMALVCTVKTADDGAEQIVGAACEQGLRRMESTVLHTNAPMLCFARALGFEVRPVPGDLTTMEIVKVL